jgi:hypothetical protein
MNDAHQIEEVGEKLRGMMPWIKANAAGRQVQELSRYHIVSTRKPADPAGFLHSGSHLNESANRKLIVPG